MERSLRHVPDEHAEQDTIVSHLKVEFVLFYLEDLVKNTPYQKGLNGNTSVQYWGTTPWTATGSFKNQHLYSQDLPIKLTWGHQRSKTSASSPSPSGRSQKMVRLLHTWKPHQVPLCHLEEAPLLTYTAVICTWATFLSPYFIKETETYSFRSHL